MRITSKVAGLAVALAATAAAAGAQVTVSGTTEGCFGAGCTNYASAASYAVDASGTSIAFGGSSFSGTTNPVTGAFTVGNFGSFTLLGLTGATPNTSFTTPFSLRFVLSAPSGASTPTESFTVSGFAGNVNGMGARDISYSGGMTTFTFTNGSGSIMTDGGQIGVQPTVISGRVMAAASTVPEPSTYALMGTGLAGLLLAARRRRAA